MPVDSINSSVWSETVKRKSRPALAGDIATDVLVIGGGMCGILTAYWLQEAGLRCIVVEAKEVGGGATHNTTAKITAQHGLIYADLIERFGLEKARQYYETNSKTVARFHALDKQYPCDFEAQTAYVYATDARRKLEREAEAYHRLGLLSRIEERPPLPLDAVGVLAMEGQAQFHPLKLLVALADGLTVYENTFVRKLESLTAHTTHGTITAKHVVLATHYPMVNILGLYFMKIYQHRSYVIALQGATPLDGMYLDEREDGHSFRSYGDLLFIGGGDHKTGEAGGGWAELRALTAAIGEFDKVIPVVDPCVPTTLQTPEKGHVVKVRVGSRRFHGGLRRGRRIIPAAAKAGCQAKQQGDGCRVNSFAIIPLDTVSPFEQQKTAPPFGETARESRKLAQSVFLQKLLHGGVDRFDVEIIGRHHFLRHAQRDRRALIERHPRHVLRRPEETLRHVVVGGRDTAEAVSGVDLRQEEVSVFLRVDVDHVGDADGGGVVEPRDVALEHVEEFLVEFDQSVNCALFGGGDFDGFSPAGGEHKQGDQQEQCENLFHD